MQVSTGMESLVHMILLLLITAAPAYVLWVIARYAEAVVYNSATPHPIVPQNPREEMILGLYKSRERGLSLLIVLLLLCSSVLVILAGFLVGGIQGTIIASVVAASMVSHLRDGLSLRERVQKRLEKNRLLLSGEAKMFG
jgi:hypothetical protein